MEEINEDFWFRSIGFYNNPFSIKPAPFDFKLFGQEDILDELMYKIPAGTMSFIEGNLGTGKSSLMKHMIHKFKGKGKVIFFSCNRIDNDLNIEELLIGKYGFWGKLFGMHPKDMILLLDESQELTAENTERVKYFFDQGNFKSVVFAGTDYSEVKLHESIRERIGEDGVLKMKKLSDDDAVELVRNRIGNLNILNDELIKKLWDVAGKNPRRLLQRCDKACKHVIDNGETEFTEDHFKEIFNHVKKGSTLSKPGKNVEEETKDEPSLEKDVDEKEEQPSLEKDVDEEKVEKKEVKKKPKKAPKPKKKPAKKKEVEEMDPEENLFEEEKD
jgi:hypothetical protein